MPSFLQAEVVLDGGVIAYTAKGGDFFGRRADQPHPKKQAVIHTNGISRSPTGWITRTAQRIGSTTGAIRPAASSWSWIAL
jgi:hypothetical protein